MTGNVAGASQKLAGVSCVVTGAARGQGRSHCVRLARAGVTEDAARAGGNNL